MLLNGFDTTDIQKTAVYEELKKYKTVEGTYLGCLFCMIADEQYTPVKKFLHEGFLAEKEQYPWTCWQ